LDVDLNADGPNPPDPGDTDVGPNGLANAPQITRASFYGGGLLVQGTLQTAAGTAYSIDGMLYPPTDPDPSGDVIPQVYYFGQTQIPAAAAPANTPFSTNFNRSFSSLPIGHRFTAVATDPSGNTSEVASSTLVYPLGYVVNANDSGPGSLRDAIVETNARPGKDTISLRLTGADRTIRLLSPLPEITDTVTITASPAYPQDPALTTIRPDESLGAGAFDGLVLSGPGNVLEAFALTGFRHAIVLKGPGGNRIGDFFVTNPSFGRHFGLAVSGNTGDGIRVLEGTGNRVRANDLLNNGGLPIDLGGDGPTPNDPLDADAGPNGLQNKPVLDSAVTSGGRTTVRGSLHAAANTTFGVDFYVSTPSRREYAGSTSVTTDAAGNAAFVFQLPTAVPQGSTMSAAATDPQGNTSEFATRVLIPLPGDANADGRTDFLDLVALAQNYGQSGRTWAQADFTGDGVTDFNDLVVLAQNYNAPAAVPVPASSVDAPEYAAHGASSPVRRSRSTPLRPVRFSDRRVVQA
jgi:hypothetical protein